MKSVVMQLCPQINYLWLWHVPHPLILTEVCYFLRLVCEDISNGQESKPIPVTNVIDDPPIAPEGESSYL